MIHPAADKTRLVHADTVIAIDGPAGSGKSTTARALAKHLDLIYVDTGAMYRALTWAAKDTDIAFDDETGLAALLCATDLRLTSHNGETRVTWNGRDISNEIRTPEVETNVSAVASHAEVRQRMVDRQRALGRTSGVVMEGRDIGSVVFPLASAKIYLDATLAARAERRLRQHRKRGVAISLDEVMHEVAERDRRDSSRTESPLTISPDAMVIDNSTMTLQEQLEVTTEAVLRILDEKRPDPPVTNRNPRDMTFQYRVAYTVMGAMGRFMGLKTYGREHAHRREGSIVAPNHISIWDPPILGAAMGNIFPIRSVAKAELFRYWPLRWMYRFLDAIPIKRTIYDSTAFDLAASFLHAGSQILFFPEGTRQVFGTPGPVRNGLGMLMQRTGAPVIPVMIRGTMLPLPGGTPRSPLEVWFAPPIRLYALRVLLTRKNEREINRDIARLFEQIYREMLARSAHEHPITQWERDAAASRTSGVRRKEARIFRKAKR
jgi:CMP/dCMP kinase